MPAFWGFLRASVQSITVWVVASGIIDQALMEVSRSIPPSANPQGRGGSSAAANIIIRRGVRRPQNALFHESFQEF